MHKTLTKLEFFKFIIPLFPILLLTGPFLPDLTITFTSIFFLIFFSKELVKKLVEEKIILFFFLFWICLVFSSLNSDFTLYSLKSSIFYVRFIIFSTALYFLISFFPKILENFFLCIKLSIYIMCIASLFEYFVGFNLYFLEKPNMRLTGTFKDEQIVGSFLSKMFPIFVSLFFYFGKKINLEFCLISLLSFLVILLSNERTAIFFTLVFYIFVILIFPEFNLKKKFLALIFIIISFLTIVFSVDDIRNRTINLTLSQMGIFLLEEQKNDQYWHYKTKQKNLFIFSESHQIHMLTAYKMFKSNLFLGVGAKVFRKKCDDKKYYISKESCTTHPHNILFQILAETGLVGLTFFIFSIFFLIKGFYSSFKKNINSNKSYLYSKLCLLFLFSQNIFFLLPSGNFLNNFLASQMFLPLGLFIFINQKIKNDSSNNSNNS